MGVDVRAPDAAGAHVDPGEREPLVRVVGELRSELPVAGPALEQRPVEEDVEERRLVALVHGGVLGKFEVAARAVEVVDIAQPLPELEDDARVDGGRRRERLELERALGGSPVEPVAEEKVGANPSAESQRDE